MKKSTSTVCAWLAALGALGALAVLPMVAGAQSRGTASRSAPASVRSHAPGVRSHVVTHRPRVGVVIGAPIVASPWWYHPYPYPYPYYFDPYYDLPAVYVQEQPSVYIEQPAPAPTPQYWYYCEASKTYYPYVQTCATPWQRVIPHAPPPQ
jgi:hypothetical protein